MKDEEKGAKERLRPTAESRKKRGCTRGKVMMMMMMMKDELTLAWRQVLRLQGHVTISLNSEVT